EHTPELKELLRAKYNQRLLQDFKTYSGKDPSRILNLYRGKEIDTRQETRFAFSFANPEYVIEMAKIFTDFLKKLATLLEKNTGSVLAHLEDPQFQPLYKPLEKIEQEREFSISRPTYDALNEGFSSLQNAGYRISNFEGHQKKTGEAVEAKFEKDWDEAKLQELDKDKRAYEITQKKRDIDIWKERAQKVLSQLPEVRLNFKDRMGEEIAVSHLDYSKYGEKFSLACIEKQKEGQKLDEEAQELQKSVELLKEEIKLRKIGEPRWLGREKYMAKTEELGQKLYELEQEIRTTKEKAREAYQSASSLVRELSEILRLSGIIDEAVKGKDFTVRELLGLAENKARENSEARLSPSEEVVYKKRLELEEAVERALQKIRKIYPNY
ncbi:MAG: hypothetical protein Q8R29_00625, partial [bacterium]|nr:hypothetical protein [bacterium]